MSSKQQGKLWVLFAIMVGVNVPVLADTIDDPCGGSSAFLNLVNRPSVGDSACVVPFKQAILEAGYQYQKLNPTGYQQNYPEAQFRLGIPANTELNMTLPTYVTQSVAPQSGYTPTIVGIKHELGYTKNWVVTVESLFALPTGSANFGSDGLGVAINGIANYTLNSLIDFTFMLGASTQTQPSNSGGQRFTSINPDMVLSYALTSKANLYGEVYGQSKTGPNQGSGFNFDGGILYLLRPFVTVDLEFGQRISGNLGGFNHYVGTGIAILF